MFSTLTRLLRLALPYWRGMLLAALLGALTIASSISLMAASAWLISKAALQPSIAELGVAVVAVRFFGLARGVLRYLERVVSHQTTFRLLARLRVAFYTALEPLAPARLWQYHSGDLLARAVADVDALQNMYLRVIAPPLTALLTALALTGLLLYFDTVTALVALGFYVLGAAALPALAWWRAHGAGRGLVAQRARTQAALVDGIQGLADILVYAPERLAEIEMEFRALAAAEARLARLDGVQAALAAGITGAAALAVAAAAIPRVDGVYVATLALATTAAFEAIGPLALAAVHLGATVKAGQRLFEIADTAPEVADPPQPAAPPVRCDLVISGLTFGHAPDARPILRDLHLSVAHGQHIAITGPSGAGKSTLANLLLRFRDYQIGQITLGGVELRTLRQADVRALFGVVAQQTHLFNTTIRENIRIGRADAADADVEQAARLAQIDAFIDSLPAGYDTLVGENGAKLSGGQRQRLALARIFLKDAPVLLLDEATANLDPVTAQAVLAAADRYAQGRTLIVLAHEPPAGIHLDAVYRLDGGRLLPG